MNLPRYQLSSDEELITFEFISEGPNGKIPKLVQFSKTNLKDVYNLAFGDKNPSTGKIDDLAISNNGDSEKIMATVVATIYAFTEKNPEAWIYATGSTNARTRLYRMGISRFLKLVKRDFEIYGEVNQQWVPFDKYQEYDSFIVKRKKS